MFGEIKMFIELAFRLRRDGTHQHRAPTETDVCDASRSRHREAIDGDDCVIGRRRDVERLLEICLLLRFADAGVKIARRISPFATGGYFYDGPDNFSTCKSHPAG